MKKGYVKWLTVALAAVGAATQLGLLPVALGELLQAVVGALPLVV